jgi:hypothetical protein
MLLHVVLIAVFGVLLPWWKGPEFLDPVLSSAYACLGILFAAPAAAQAFSGGGPRKDGTPTTRPQTMPDALLRIGRAVGYGEGLALIFLAAGVVTVNLTRSGSLRFPQLDTLAETAVLGLAASTAMAMAAAWLALRFSAATARRGMRVCFLALLAAYYYWSFRLPEIAVAGAAICALIALGLLYLVWREVAPR